ncbi:hypothetical protein SGFS_036010 [Streptomyces graminofaciens]|uniref:Uncharacterized protein n=1 Tax=Streptomyces graminofaciens TaxID=68212 RepID=A0ABN5VG48_9ACTN|nr:hypothetical protein SGFS_036010 [Streptomyces graminofaciens]
MAAGDVARVMMCELASGVSGGGSPGELVAAVLLSPEQDGLGLDARLTLWAFALRMMSRATGSEQGFSGIRSG